MQKPTIELRAVQHNERMSEETNCYSAKLYVDGAFWGEVSNHGHGGSDDFRPAKGRTYADLAALNARIAATYPASDLGDGVTLDEDLEGICCALLTEFLIARDMKRALRTKVMFVAPDKPGLRYFALKQKGRTYAVDQMIAHVQKLAPAAKILNTLPEADALALYRAHG